MFDYEFEQAGYNLDEIKEKLKDYLLNSYHVSDNDPKNQAKKTFRYLENLVDCITKRKNYTMQFDSGGSPLWHATIFSYLAQWVRIEIKLCEMLSEELSVQLEED